jgi:DNA-binding MarR family transcriptional regulator
MENLQEVIIYLSDFIEKILKEAIDSSDFNDLTQKQLHYLNVLVRMSNPTLSEFAMELGLTRPTVTVLVDKLAEKGYIKRVHSDEDKRVMHLHIDKKGAKISALREIAHTRVAEEIKSVLSKSETAVLTELLKKIAIRF